MTSGPTSSAGSMTFLSTLRAVARRAVAPQLQPGTSSPRLSVATPPPPHLPLHIRVPLNRLLRPRPLLNPLSLGRRRRLRPHPCLQQRSSGPRFCLATLVPGTRVPTSSPSALSLLCTMVSPHLLLPVRPRLRLPGRLWLPLLLLLLPYPLVHPHPVLGYWSVSVMPSTPPQGRLLRRP